MPATAWSPCAWAAAWAPREFSSGFSKPQIRMGIQKFSEALLRGFGINTNSRELLPAVGSEFQVNGASLHYALAVASAFSRAFSLLLYRDAVLPWTTPFCTLLSSADTVARYCAWAAEASPFARAS